MRRINKRMTKRDALTEARRLGMKIVSAPVGGIWLWESLNQCAQFIPDHTYTDHGVFIASDKPGYAKGKREAVG